nr:MAG TPA: hypothetical protein [Caudoviricetes sp.]
MQQSWTLLHASHLKGVLRPPVSPCFTYPLFLLYKQTSPKSNNFLINS